MKIITNKHEEILVDDEDYVILSQHHWYVTNGYAITTIDDKKVRMHRLIMDAPKGLEVDHINGNRIDNRRSNLRLVTRQQNGKNLGINPRNKSGVTGVYWHDNRWCAHICVDGKDIYLGRFQTLYQAAKVRKEAENRYGITIRV